MKNYPIYIYMVILLAHISACRHTDAAAAKNETAITDSIIRKVKTAPATMDDVVESIKLNGKIIPDENKQAKVYALVSGKLKTVSVELGDHVNKGQPLAVLQSTEAADASNDLSMAESNLSITQKNLESIQELYASQLATEKDVVLARLEFNKAGSALNRAKEIAAITGGSNATYTLYAPLSGTIIEKTVTGNSQVRQDNSSSLFTVANLSTVWVMASVYESDIDKIHIGDHVIVNVLSNTNKNYSGKIDKIYNVLDPVSRTMKVRITMNNAGNELKAEMFATINVKGTAEGKMLSIPSRAVVLDESKQYVVVKTGDQLQIKPVQVNKRIGDKSFITGLTEGELVVTDAQVFLYEALHSK